MSFQKNLGLLFLSIFLIIWGLGAVIGFTFNAKPIVEGILALIAGVLILIGR